MTCEHGECGCAHDHGVVTEERQAETHNTAGCCGGHHGSEAATDDRLEAGQGA